MIFRNADSLKRDYTVCASFYRIDINNTEVLCRNVCDISRNNIGISDKIDAYLILMNPGSCRPIDLEYIIPKYDKWENIKVDMVKCQPDQAQYQVMKLMDNKMWNCVRMINLSDIVMGNSKEFIQLISSITCDYHSLFSEIREENREEIMKDDAKVIASWGKSKELKYYAKLCKESIIGKEILGIPYDNEHIFYKYIKPMLVKQQIELLEEFNTIIKL